MDFSFKRTGKIATLAALTDEEEEKKIKQELASDPHYRLAITVVSGISSEVKQNFVKSIIGCALQNNIIVKSSGNIHAVVHAALDALNGVVHQVPADSSLKLKVAIVSDGKWIAVAIYGDSAFYPMTNHERSSMSMMHLAD
jgi:hut operon positive regulator